MDVMLRGFKAAVVSGILGFVLICWVFLDTRKATTWMNFSGCGLCGIVVSYVFILSTQYYTDYKYGPVQQIARSSMTGHATNIISGLSVGLESTAIPVITISIGIIIAFTLGENCGLKDHKSGSPIGG